MKLDNPFSQETRNFFLYQTWCDQCGSSTGGLELHHIRGRISSSIFNSSVICLCCHKSIKHTQEEEQKLFAITFKKCYNLRYKVNENDIDFISRNYDYLFTDDLKKWLANLN